MEKASRIYTDDQMNMIIGHLKGTRYVEDTQAVLAKSGKKYSDGYINRVFGKFSYSEPVWDALNAVALARQAKRKQIAESASQLEEASV